MLPPHGQNRAARGRSIGRARSLEAYPIPQATSARAARRAGHPLRIGDEVLVGPHAHLNGALAEAGAFLATGAD